MTTLIGELHAVASSFGLGVRELVRSADDHGAQVQQTLFDGEHEEDAVHVVGETDLGRGLRVERHMPIQSAAPWDASCHEHHDSAGLVVDHEGEKHSSVRLQGGYLERAALCAVDWTVLKMVENGEAAVGRVAGHCANEAALLRRTHNQARAQL